MKLRKLAIDHPAAAAIACALLQFAITIAILEAGLHLLPQQAFGKVKLLAFASTVALPLWLTHALGLWRQVGFRLRYGRPTFFLVATALVCAPYLVHGIDLAARGNVAGEALLQLVNAFGEELLFRGVIFALLLGLPVWRAMLLSSVLFGAMHLIHGVMDGNWPAAIHQAFVTTAGGLLFVAVRLRTGSLWLAIASHMLVNLSVIFSNIGPTFGAAGENLAQNVAIVAELALAGWVMLAASRRAHEAVPAAG